MRKTPGGQNASEEQEQAQTASPRASGTPQSPVGFPVSAAPSPLPEPAMSTQPPVRTRVRSSMASTSARIHAALTPVRPRPALAITTRTPSGKRKRAPAEAPTSNSTPTAAASPTPHRRPSSSFFPDPMTLSGQQDILSSAPTPLDISRWIDGQPSQWIGLDADELGDGDRYIEDPFSPRNV